MTPAGPKASLISGEDSSAVVICRRESAEEGLEYRFLTPSSVESPNSNCVRSAMSEESSSVRHNLDVSLWSTLDNYLLEEIIARLSFKSFFRVSSSLSKTWKLRVQSPSFQRELQKSSSSWESYCPVFMYSEKELVGYERGSKRWHRLPTHSYLQQDAGWDRRFAAWLLRAAAGSLFCWTRRYPCLVLNRGDPEHVHVMNPLTRSWKQLPLRPEMQFPTFVHIYLDGSTAYKVLLGTTELETLHRGRASIRVQIFDSTNESWTIEVYTCAEICTGTDAGNSVESTFMNGVLYVLVRKKVAGGYGFVLISLDVKNVVWSETHLLFAAVSDGPIPRDHLFLHAMYYYKVFVCGSHVMMAIHYKGDVSNMSFATAMNQILCVFKLDVKRGTAFEVSRAPHDLLRLVSAPKHFCTAAAHHDCIYIRGVSGNTNNEPSILVYHVGIRQWHQIPYPPKRSSLFRQMNHISYQPGLNPQLEV